MRALPIRLPVAVQVDGRHLLAVRLPGLKVQLGRLNPDGVQHVKVHAGYLFKASLLAASALLWLASRLFSGRLQVTVG